MSSCLNIPANSKLIGLLNRHISALSAVSDSVDRDDLDSAYSELQAIENAIVCELHFLAAEANLLQGGL